MSSRLPFPHDFLCEHTPSKSRVFAVLSSSDRPDTLKAVLTCTNPLLAQRAASVLTSLALTGGGPMIHADAEAIRATLPSAPAASFSEACQRLRDLEWPEADASPAVEWDQVQFPDERDLTPALRDEEARTPSDVRLGQLTGKVFRIVQFAEYHVYDPDRLLHAAAADGWPPVSAEDDDENDDADDLLDAIMHLASVGSDVPGAGVVSQQSTGRRLVVSAGDELADWQQEPVTAEFGGGWRLNAEPPGGLGGDHDDDDSIEPDFVALFPVRSCERDHANWDEEMECDICGDWQLTPRTADMLHTALENLSDEAYNDVEEHGSDPVTRENANDWDLFDRFPRITWQTDGDWRRQVARACEDLSQDLAAGHWPSPRNNAEEMALHLAIEDAPDYLEMAEDSGDEKHKALPEYPDDCTWDQCSSLFFQDHDVLMLFDESLDGFEDPSTDINKHFRVGDLRPEAWFKFFNNMKPRDPNRGFRR
ncbi:MAG: hypothetical protein ACRDOI_35260 [Trebonia sp.]